MRSTGNVDTTWGWLRMEMTELSSYFWCLQQTNWEGLTGEPLNGSELVQRPGWFITCTRTPTNIHVPVLANLILRLPIMFLYLEVLLVTQSYMVESIIWGYHIYDDIWTNSSLLMRGKQHPWSLCCRGCWVNCDHVLCVQFSVCYLFLRRNGRR